MPATFADDFLLYWALLALGLVQRSGAGRLRPQPAGQPDPGPGAARPPQSAPVAGDHPAARPAATHAQIANYDVVLTPTLADETPPIGHLDPTADYQQIIYRLDDWVAFTPLQNVTGDPAISLPLAVSANGMPIGMMFSAAVADTEVRCWN